MKTRIVALVVSLLVLVSFAPAQHDTTWSKWNWLVGQWVGEGGGTPGEGSGWFSFELALDGKILIRKNHSEYPATKDRPAVVHDDLMIVYSDVPGSPGRAIYFDNEGHTINYSVAHSGTAIVLTSEKIQNMPLFRLTYVPLEKNTVNVKFEMSQDGKTFRTYTEGKCRKKI